MKNPAKLPSAAVSVIALLLCLPLGTAAATRYVNIDNSNPVSPFNDWATAATGIQDAIDVAEAGDEVVVTNGIYATGERGVGTNLLANRVVVDKPIMLRSVNGPGVTIIEGNQVPVWQTGYGAVRCVYLASGATLVGFTLTNGATRGKFDPGADRNGGGVWCESGSSLVTNCVLWGNVADVSGGGAFAGSLFDCLLKGNRSGSYGGGVESATLDHCILTGNETKGDGGGACNSTLRNCNLTNNATTPGYRGSGGGVSWGILDHCVLVGNRAEMDGGGACESDLTNCLVMNNSAGLLGDGDGAGGGAVRGILDHCTLIGNSADLGGGSCGATLINCLLSGNSADFGGGDCVGALTNCTLVGNSAGYSSGGSESGILNNCIVYNNSAPTNENYDFLPRSNNNMRYAMYNCCTIPLPAYGWGNFTNAPLFVDLAGGNLHLQSNSPCINSGRNAYASGAVDLNGNPRIVGGTVDVGAYEFEFPASVISYAWLQQYGLPTDGTADHLQSDADGMDNWQEWIAGTDPTNATSGLWMLSPTSIVSGVKVCWTSVTNRTYSLEHATTMITAASFSLLQSNIVGLAEITSFTDTNTTDGAPRFYRVRVEQ